MTQAGVAFAQTFVGRADGGEPLRMVFRRKLAHQFQIAPTDGFVVGVVRYAEQGVWIVHGSPPFPSTRESFSRDPKGSASPHAPLRVAAKRRLVYGTQSS